MSREMRFSKPPKEQPIVPTNAKNGFPPDYRKKFMKKAPFDFPKLSRDLQLLIFKHMVHLFKDPLYNLGKVSNTWYYIFNNVNYQARFWGKMSYARTISLLKNLKCPPNEYALSVMSFEEPPEEPARYGADVLHYDNSYANTWLMHYTPITWKNLPLPNPKSIKIYQFREYMRLAFLRGEEATSRVCEYIVQALDRRRTTELGVLDYYGVNTFFEAYDKKLLSETFAVWCLNQDWFPKNSEVVTGMVLRGFSSDNINDYIRRHTLNERHCGMDFILRTMRNILFDPNPEVSENISYYLKNYRNFLIASCSSIVSHEFLNILDRSKKPIPDPKYAHLVNPDLIKSRLELIEECFISVNTVHPTADIFVYADYESKNKAMFRISNYNEESRKKHIRLQKVKRLEKDRENALYTGHKSYLLYKDSQYDPDDEDTLSDDHPE